MAYVMLQYNRPTDTQHWNEYNQHVRDWIAQLLQLPGAVSFMAYRTAHQESPDTFTMLEFRTMQEAQRAAASEPMKRVLDELRSTGAVARVLLMERSPFTPEPILA
jgi:lipopolysaccharide/colanic/teichoic acid biosynthesis glycosyltransferase